MEKYNVYCLHLASTGKVFYVGITQKQLQKRLKEHLRRSLMKSKEGNWKFDFTNAIYLRNVNHNDCEIMMISDNLTKEEACEKERDYIDWCSKIGIKLNNDTIGGDGVHISPDKIKAIGEKTRKRLLRDGPPRKFLEKAIEYGRACKGKKINEETKEKISQSLSGRRFTDEHRQKISESNIGRQKYDNNCGGKSFAHNGSVLKIDEQKLIQLRTVENKTMKQIAEYFNVSFDSIRYVFRKLRKKGFKI
jgi:hypothetical protein